MFPDTVGTKIRNFEKPDRVRNDERKFKLICTNDVSVRTNRTDRYKYHSEKDGIFLLQKCHPKRRDGV